MRKKQEKQTRVNIGNGMERDKQMKKNRNEITDRRQQIFLIINYPFAGHSSIVSILLFCYSAPSFPIGDEQIENTTLCYGSAGASSLACYLYLDRRWLHMFHWELHFFLPSI